MGKEVWRKKRHRSSRAENPIALGGQNGVLLPALKLLFFRRKKRRKITVALIHFFHRLNNTVIPAQNFERNFFFL